MPELFVFFKLTNRPAFSHLWDSGRSKNVFQRPAGIIRVDIDIKGAFPNVFCLNAYGTVEFINKDTVSFGVNIIGPTWYIRLNHIYVRDDR